jgi:hypothetical protein
MTNPDDGWVGYLLGWLCHDIGDAAGAEARMIQTASIINHAKTPETSALIPITEDKSLSFELAVQALFFAKQPEKSKAQLIISEHIAAHRIVVSVQELLQLAEPSHRDQVLAERSTR